MRKVSVIKPNADTAFGGSGKKLRVAAYARVSTSSSEQLESFSAQVKHYNDLIQSNPAWIFAGIYADEGISGTKKDNRSEFLRLIADCEAKRMDLVITKSISRFARNTTDCLEAVRKLTELGIGIFFEKEMINTMTSESELILSVLSSLAAEESVSISQNSKWSIKRRFQNGTFKLALPPYGYDFNGVTLIPNQEQAQVVRRIFKDALSGLGTRAIARILSDEGIKPPRSKIWNATVVRGILINERYVGDALYQKTYTDSRFKRHLNSGEQEMYYIKDNHEAIISREDFEAAGRVLKQRGKDKGNTGETSKYQRRYALSGMIICGECSGTFKRRIHRKSKDSTYIAYGCKNHIESNGEHCSMLAIKEETIHTAFVTMMNKLYSNRNEILKPLLDGLKQLDDSGKYVEIQKIEKQIKEIQEQGQVLVGLLSKGYLDPALYNAKNNLLSKQAEELREKKRLLQSDMAGDNAIGCEVEELYQYFCKEGRFLEVFSEELVGRFVERITVLDAEQIGFQLKCGLFLKERG